MSIAISKAGEFEGQRVDEAVLESSDGIKVHLLNWGVTVRDWRVPVKGGIRPVVLGFESFDAYPAYSPYFGALAGRVANRIGGASFMLDGKRFTLAPNEGTTQLHGGPKGIGRQVWSMEADSAQNAVRFVLDSPDSDMGYPGNVRFVAVYSLAGKTLRLEISALPDRPTPISVVQHHYFNLGVTNNVLDHKVHMPHCVARTEVDGKLIPTGVISPVAGTAFDFREPRNLRGAEGAPIDYDLNLVLATGRKHSDPIAIVAGEDGELTLKLTSDQPGLQFYNGVTTDVAAPGLGGRTYGRYSGLCFEDQKFPDAVNHLHFPDIICTPDRPYSHWCEIEIA